MEQRVREAIEKRAYDLFIERGGHHGYHIEDWVRAEQEVLGQKQKPAAKKKAAAKPVAKTAKTK